MGIAFSLTASVILLVFYLVLLVFPKCIKRRPLFLLGSGGVALTLIAGFFSPWPGRPWADAIVAVFATVGTLIAFAGAFLACYGGELPVNIPGMQEKEAEAPADQTA